MEQSVRFLRKLYSRLIIWEGVPSSFLFGISGVFGPNPTIQGFLLLLGASTFHISLTGAIPAVTQMISIFVPFLFLFTTPKRLWTLSGLLFRGVWLLLVPLVPLVKWGPTLFLLVAFLGAIMAAINMNAYTTWVPQLTEEKERGKIFGTKNMLAGAVSAVFGLVVGRLLDCFKGASIVYPLPGAGIFVFVFVAASLFSLPAIFILKNLPEAPVVPSRPSRDTWISVLKNSNLMWWTACGFLMNMGFSSLITFANYYFLKKLGLSFTVLSYLGVLATAVNLVGNIGWGYLIDKFGPFTIVRLSILMAIPANLFLILFKGICGAALWSFVLNLAMVGYFLGGYNFFLEISEERSRHVSSSIVTAVPGIATMISPVLASLFFKYIGFEGIFISSSVFFLVSFVLTRNLREVRQLPVKVLFSRIGTFNVLSLISGLYSLYHATTPQKKVMALETLSRTGTKMATEEIEKLLDDPSHFVRRKAAETVGKLGVKEVVKTLEKMTEDPDIIVRDRAIEALIRIGDENSILKLKALLKRIKEPRARIMIIETLIEKGKISTEELRSLLHSKTHVSVGLVVAVELGRRGDKLAARKLWNFYQRCQHPLAKLEVAGALADIFGGRKDEYYKLVSLEKQEKGEGVARILQTIAKKIKKLDLSKIELAYHSGNYAEMLELTFNLLMVSGKEPYSFFEFVAKTGFKHVTSWQDALLLFYLLTTDLLS